MNDEIIIRNWWGDIVTEEDLPREWWGDVLEQPK